MKRLHIIFLICFICLMGCRPKRRANLYLPRVKEPLNLKAQIKHDRTIQKFKLELVGIECKFCARAAVELLEQIPGVILAEYVCGNSKNFNLQNGALDQSPSLTELDQDLSKQISAGEITSMLDTVYNEVQTGKKPAHNYGRDYIPVHVHNGVNKFPGYVNLYYKPRENLQLPDVKIKQVLNSDGFDLKSIQPS